MLYLRPIRRLKDINHDTRPLQCIQPTLLLAAEFALLGFQFHEDDMPPPRQHQRRKARIALDGGAPAFIGESRTEVSHYPAAQLGILDDLRREVSLGESHYSKGMALLVTSLRIAIALARSPNVIF